MKNPTHRYEKSIVMICKNYCEYEETNRCEKSIVSMWRIYCIDMRSRLKLYEKIDYIVMKNRPFKLV